VEDKLRRTNSDKRGDNRWTIDRCAKNSRLHSNRDIASEMGISARTLQERKQIAMFSKRRESGIFPKLFELKRDGAVIGLYRLREGKNRRGANYFFR
jgi:hypothetical protein